MAISRNELVAKYQLAKAKIKELENKNYDYKISRPCDPFGKVCNMNIESVVRAGASIHDQDKTLKACIELYGVTEADMSAEKRKFLGYTVDEWDHDLKLRVQEIHDGQDLEKYRKAASLLSKNFTDDDKFTMDMQEISTIGITLE